MPIEPFPLILAFLPLAAYLLLIGSVRLFAAPLVTTAARDAAALAVGISGLVAIGPAELFFPAPAAAAMGGYVWLVLLLFYVLAVSLVILSMQPKLVVYGISADGLVAPLHRAAAELDADAVADPRRRQVHLPTLGVRLRVDGSPLLDVAQVAAFEQHLSPAFWNRLLALLRREVKTAPRSFSVAGVLMILAGSLFSLPPLLAVLISPEEVVTGFKEWLWR